MPPRYEPLLEPFSTADAEYPRVISELGGLRVAFRDWREKLVEIRFYDVVGFSWDEGEAGIDENHRDDCSYIVHDSSWLARHHEMGVIMKPVACRHYKLCFNSIGVLQVLASRIETLDESDAASGSGGHA